MFSRKMLLTAFTCSMGVIPWAADSAPDAPWLASVQTLRFKRSALQPWRKEPVQKETRSALHVGDGLYLITDYGAGTAISFPTESVESSLLASDAELRLALISARQAAAVPGTVSFDGELGNVRPGTQLRCLSREKARLSDVTFVFEGLGAGRSPEGNTDIPVINFSGWAPWITSGDLLFFNGLQLAGVVIRFDQATRTGTAVPASFVKQFLDDARRKAGEVSGNVIIQQMDEVAEDPRRTVVLNSGFVYEDLKSPVLRASYGLLPGRNAALVTRVFPYGGGDGILLPGDVILSIDGRVLERGSTLTDATWGSLPAGVAVGMRGLRFRQPGERVQLEIVRRRVIEKITITISPFSARNYRIPPRSDRAPYLVLAGLVFLEANGQYFSEGSSNERFDYLESLGRYVESKGRERYVVLDRILSTKATSGYRWTRELLLSVNGRAVRDIPHLKSLVDELSRQAGPIVFGFESNRIVVVDPAEIRDADEEVRIKHGIQYLYEAGSGSGLD